MAEMPDHEFHLARAPIAEALISLQIEPMPGDKLHLLEAAAAEIRSDYPASEAIAQLGFQLRTLGGQVEASHQGQPWGYRLTSEDKRQIVLLQLDRFSFSRLHPYERWDGFKTEARRLWSIYSRTIGPVRIRAFGLRYINKLHIPFGRSLSEFLNIYPEIADYPDGTAGKTVSSYLRVDSILEVPSGQLIIQQASLPADEEGHAALSLDFDLQFNNLGQTEEYVWDTLETARHLKNQLFVDSLKPTYLETFRK